MQRLLNAIFVLLAVATSSGCGDTFSCGDQGGDCKLDAEVCVVAGGCSTCIPAPADCTECGCLGPANGESFASARCIDDGHCFGEDGGLSVSCAEADGWSCG